MTQGRLCLPSCRKPICRSSRACALIASSSHTVCGAGMCFCATQVSCIKRRPERRRNGCSPGEIPRGRTGGALTSSRSRSTATGTRPCGRSYSFRRICLALEGAVAVLMLEESGDRDVRWRLHRGPRPGRCWVNNHEGCCRTEGSAYHWERRIRHAQARCGLRALPWRCRRFRSRPGPDATTTILVLLGNGSWQQGLAQFLESHGYRCCVGESTTEPHAIIVDTATIAKALSLGYPRARILFLQMEQDAAQVAALLSWHRADAIIPPSAGLQGFKKVLQAVGERSRAWSRALAGTEVPVPFTPQERKGHCLHLPGRQQQRDRPGAPYQPPYS